MTRDRPRAPWPAKAVLLLSLFALYAPLLSVIFYSFGLPGPPHLDFYRTAAGDHDLMEALFQSLRIAGTSTLLSTVLGTLGALGLSRLPPRTRRKAEALILLPLALPEIVFGISLLAWFVFLKLTLGTVSLILAHTTFTVSFVLLTVRAQLQSLDPALEEAGADLGASSANVFWKIIFPLLIPGIGAGAFLAFALSFDDFLVSFFTTGVGTDPLPLKLYAMSRIGVSGPIHALGTGLLALSAASALGAFLALGSSRKSLIFK